MRVHVCIAHYTEERTQPEDNPIGNGSLAPGSRFHRTLALSRCLHGLLGTQRHPEMVLLDIHQRRFDHFPAGHTPLEVSISIGTDGVHRLDDVLQHFGSQVDVLTLKTTDPRNLGLACRDHLIANRAGADLLMYLEDDLVIHDPAFFDKQHWFLEKTGHHYCLMPHRYEVVHAAGMHQVLVDGPLDPDFLNPFQTPQRHTAKGLYQGRQQVCFDLADNPHSGCFVISARQADALSRQELPTDGFVGSLETAATYTVLQHYPVMKPSLENWQFLQIEHAHHSFSGYLNTFPHQVLSIPDGPSTAEQGAP